MGLSRFIDPVWDCSSSGQAFLWPPITPSPWGGRRAVVGANAAGNPRLSLSLCVTQDNKTVIRCSSRTPGWQRENEMETLTKKDPPRSLESCNKEEFTGWYETNAPRLCRGEARRSYSNLQLYSSIKMEALMCCNHSLDTFT